MSEWLPFLSFAFNVVLTIGAGIGGWFLRNALKTAKNDHTIDDLMSSIAALKEGFGHLDEAIRGNGKIGLCEQTRNLDRRVGEMDRRLMKLEDAA